MREKLLLLAKIALLGVSIIGAYWQGYDRGVREVIERLTDGRF